MSRAGCAALAAAVLLTACASQEASSPEALPTPPTTAVAPLDPAELEPLVLDDAPSGFTRAADEVGRAGATDLSDAAADARDPDAGPALADAGFRRGWQRLWVSDDDTDELFLVVYEFDEPAGASSFFELTAGEPAAEGGEGVFEVPAIPGAVGVSASAEGLAVSAVMLTTGPYLVQVIANGPDPGPSRGTVVAVAAAQAERLR